jgi:hypothetical protein
MTPDAARPHWERGYRAHGYWLGIARLGVVTIGPRGFRRPGDGYLWRLDSWWHNAPSLHAPTLRAAKRAVEARHRAEAAGEIAPYGPLPDPIPP